MSEQEYPADIDTLPDDAIVIRAGEVMTVMGITEALQSHYDYCEALGKPKVYWLSVNSLPDADYETIAARAKRPNPKQRVSSTRLIRDAGWEIVPTPGRQHKDAHCDAYVRVSDTRMPTPQEILSLISAFAEIKDNPTARSKRKRP